MYRTLFRLSLAAAIASVSLAVGLAQERPKDVDDYRRFFRPPENPVEFWKAIQFEIDVGRPDLAARHVAGLLNIADKDGKNLLSIVDKDGLAAVLRLKNVRVWYDKDEKLNAQALKDVADFVDRTSGAYRERLQDERRIRDFIAQLGKAPEQKEFALRELYKMGSAAVPVLLADLAGAAEPADRLLLREALETMDPGDSLAPVLAALDSRDARFQSELLDLIRRKHARYAPRVAPFLIFPANAPSVDSDVRRKAKKLLADLTNTVEDKLPAAKLALTREAEKFYQGKMDLGDKANVVVWRWDAKDRKVVKGWPGAETISPEQATEYWGLRFARQALTLDPEYRPAQLVFLGLAVRSRPGPEAADLVARSSPELLIELLERSLREGRKPEAIAVIRALGDRAEVRALRPGVQADSALVRALFDPDPAIHFEAAQTLLLIPGTPAPKTALRIVEILGRQLTPATAHRPGRRVLVAIGDEAWRYKAADAAEKSGAVAIPVGDGREALRQLRARGDVDAILLDSSLPNPGLANLLAQLRADVDFGKVPILLAAVPQTRSAHDLAVCFKNVQYRLDVIAGETRAYSLRLASVQAERKAALEGVKKSKRDPDALDVATRNVEDEFARTLKNLDSDYLTAARLTKDVAKLEAKKDRLTARYDAESRLRETELERFTSRYANVRVVNASVLTDAAVLDAVTAAAIRQADVAQPADVRARNAETAIQILSKLAQGTPPGYDVRPAEGPILAALRAGKLKSAGQIAAVDAVARIPGAKAQGELLNALIDPARPVEVRKAAGEGLVVSLQKNGNVLTRQQTATVSELNAQPNLDPRLKSQTALVLGALRACDRKTGELLRKYDPQPVAPLAPPEEKDKGKDKDKDKEKKD